MVIFMLDVENVATEGAVKAFAKAKIISVVWWRSECAVGINLEFNYKEKGLRMVN
jgi:hypothetical protein